MGSFTLYLFAVLLCFNYNCTPTGFGNNKQSRMEKNAPALSNQSVLSDCIYMYVVREACPACLGK